MRLKNYDYSQPGAYFITLVTYQREMLFGRVAEGKMEYSRLGKIVREEWIKSNRMRREIQLNEDEFIVMPNHIHGIVWITVGADVGADGVRPKDKEGACHAPQQEPQPESQPVPHFSRLPRSLSSFVAGFKAAVTSRAGRELNMTGIWQRNYYDHIIRSEMEWVDIWNYIDTNPQRWVDDELHKHAK